MGRTSDRTPYSVMTEEWISHGAGFSVQDDVKIRNKRYIIFTYAGRGISRQYKMEKHTSFDRGGHSLKNWYAKVRRWAHDSVAEDVQYAVATPQDTDQSKVKVKGTAHTKMKAR